MSSTFGSSLLLLRSVPYRMTPFFPIFLLDRNRSVLAFLPQPRSLELLLGLSSTVSEVGEVEVKRVRRERRSVVFVVVAAAVVVIEKG